VNIHSHSWDTIVQKITAAYKMFGHWLIGIPAINYPVWKEIFPDSLLTSWLTQFGQVTTCAFIIAIQRCKLRRATCRRFDTIPACDGRTDRQTDRQTDGQTEGIAVANTALAMPTTQLCVKEQLHTKCIFIGWQRDTLLATNCTLNENQPQYWYHSTWKGDWMSSASS